MRAIASVVQQQSVRAQPLVIVNGGNADPGLLWELTQRTDISVSRLDRASMAGALQAGRALVDSRWFSELDDDDELLPGALASRLARLRGDEALDAVVSNGVIRDARGDHPSIDDVARVERDPLRALLRQNWLLPGAALFRESRIEPAFFDAILESLEWTSLGINLALRRRLAFMAEPSVIHYRDHPFSVERSREAALRRPHALDILRELPLPRDVQIDLERRAAGAHHDASALHLAEGNLGAAWRAHARSLSLRHGWRYLPYTRRLLFARLRP